MYLKHRLVLISTWNSKILESEYRDGKENVGSQSEYQRTRAYSLHPTVERPALLQNLQL